MQNSLPYVRETGRDLSKPMTFSASRITTYMSCNRKAGWLYIAGYDDPGNIDTDFGKQVHDALFHFARNPALLPDLTDPVQAVAAEALPHIMSLIEDTAQFEGEITVVGKHRWTGFRDLNPRPGLVIDYKTTGDFRNAKTPEQLSTDPQAILYAIAELRAHPELEHVDLMWLYLKKKKTYAAKPVEARVTRAEAEAGFAALESYADEMQSAAYAAPRDPVARHKYVLNVLTPNWGHCNAYRGCPYKDRCTDRPMFSPPNEKDKEMGLLQRLQEMANGLPVTPPAAPPPVTPAIAPAIPPPPRDTQLPPAEAPTSPATPSAMPPAVTAGINPPRRRGRPPGAKNKVVDAPEAGARSIDDMVAATVSTTVPAPAPVLESVPPAVAGPHQCTALFVGCLPRGHAFVTVDFDAMVADAKKIVGDQDYRLFEFGKGNGLLLDAFTRVFDYTRPEAVIVLSPTGPEATLCLSFLRSRTANMIVEAVR